MENKHTPAPWLIANNGKKKQKTYTFRIWRTDADQPQGDDFENRGYTCIAPHVHGEANARLIASAPDLIEALEAALDLIEYNDIAAADTISFIKSTISKARGDK